jgi:hypothetical protein
VHYPKELRTGDDVQQARKRRSFWMRGYKEVDSYGQLDCHPVTISGDERVTRAKIVIR